MGSDTQLPLDLPPLPRNRLETIEDLLEQSGREAVPIRNGFLQLGRGAATKPGPMSAFVEGGDARGLEAYLLLHAVASAEPWDATYPSHTWVRALGLRESADARSARAAVSKTMRRLVTRRLVAPSRTGRYSTLTLLREDASGEPYTRPQTKADPWFQLPYIYWSGGHFRSLDLPSKAVLLIGLSLPADFTLPLEQASRWYGIGAKTAQRGISRLESEGLLDRRVTYQADPRSETGWVSRHRFTLKVPFARPSRKGSD